MNIIPFFLFSATFVPTLIMVRQVFKDSDLQYAGYVMAVVSAITTTLLLSNPVGFLSAVFSAGILPAIMMILFAGFCLIPLGAFIIMLFVGLKVRIPLLLNRDHFNHHVSGVQVHEEWIPEPSHEGRSNFGISEVGRQQITRLIRAQKGEEDDEQDGYVYISSG